MRQMLVTGSSGLIGSEVCAYFCGEGWKVHGIDNNGRAEFFGPGVIRAGINAGSKPSCRTLYIMSWTYVTAGASSCSSANCGRMP